MYKLF